MHYCNALRELWADDIQAAEQKTLQLTQALIQDNRLEELAKAVLDADLRGQLFKEYGL